MANTTLKQGSRGGEVTTLQTYLNSNGYDVGAADGIFGAKTLAGVKAYQTASGLTSDGIVGANTWGSINTPKVTTAPAAATTDTPVVNKDTSADNKPTGLISYNPLTGEQIKSQAENRINPLYNAEVEAVTQAADRNKLAMQNQIESRQALHGQQKEELAALYGQQMTQSQNSILKRGMGRSSIGANAEARVQNAEAGAVGKLQQSLQMDLGHIQSQITQLEGQLADSISRMDIDKVHKIQAEIDRLHEQEHSKQMEITKANNAHQQGEQQFGLQQETFEHNKTMDQKNYDWKVHMDNENLKLSKAKALLGGGSGGNNSALKGDAFDRATPDQRTAFNRWQNNLITNRNPNITAQTVYNNLRTVGRDHYKSLLGDELYNILLEEAEAAYRGHTPTEQKPPTLGATVSSFMDAVDKGSWVTENFPNIPDDHVKHIEGYLKDNKDSANSMPQLISAYLTAMKSEGSRFDFNDWLDTYIKSANLSNKEIDDFMRFYNNHSKIN